MSGEEEAAELTIAEDLVVTKYKMGGDIANRVLRAVLDAANSGASVLCLCEKGDSMIMEETGKIFKKEKEMKKGIAFPTSISVNNCVCHFSPLKSDQDYILKDGDLVKVDLGVHVDGFIANVAHSFVIEASKEKPVSGRKADVIKAAHLCAEAALRLVKPGNQNTQVTEAWNKIAHSFHCTPIEGMLSHQLKQHVIDGEKTIIQNPTDQQKKDHEKAEFEVHEVYAVDVLVSSGEGKGVRGREEGADGSGGMRQARAAAALQRPLREGRGVCGPVQVHGAPDAQRSHADNGRPLRARPLQIRLRGAGCGAQGPPPELREPQDPEEEEEEGLQECRERHHGRDSGGDGGGRLSGCGPWRIPVCPLGARARAGGIPLLPAAAAMGREAPARKRNKSRR
uniref:Peptidase M24 domain-containing protein n=1 Tax=Amazona collaria TaxID=241587 RepID=A0A8B9FBP8_9PSIT